MYIYINEFMSALGQLFKGKQGTLLMDKGVLKYITDITMGILSVTC